VVAVGVTVVVVDPAGVIVVVVVGVSGIWSMRGE